MASQESKNAEMIVFEIAQTLGFKNFTLNSHSPLRAGYLGVIFKVKIEGNMNGIPKSLNLVVKHVPLTEYHNFFKIHTFYHTESQIYSSVFKEFDSLQNDAGIKEKFLHCKMYKSILEPSKESIVMEDITVKGFIGSIKGKVMDLEHSKLSLRELGKFHALSFAMKHTRLEKYNEITNNITERLFSTETNKYIEIFIRDSITHAMEILENPEGIQKMNKLKEVAFDMCFDLIQSKSAAPNAVICHGDLWSNNVLFKYNGVTPVEAILLDWQTIRHHSPILDVLFFIVTSVADDISSTHYEQLLKVYHTSLSDFLVELKCDPDELYSEETFHEDIRKFAKVALVNALLLLPLLSNDEHDIVYDVSILSPEFAEDGQRKLILGCLHRPELYVNRVRCIVDLFLEQNLL